MHPSTTKGVQLYHNFGYSPNKTSPNLLTIPTRRDIMTIPKSLKGGVISYDDLCLRMCCFCACFAYLVQVNIQFAFCASNVGCAFFVLPMCWCQYSG